MSLIFSQTLNVSECGLHGVFISSGEVTIEGEVVVSNSQGDGVRIEKSTCALDPGTAGSLSIDESGNAGVYAFNSSVSVVGVTITNSATGIYSTSGSDVTVTASTIDGALVGFCTDSSSELYGSNGGSDISQCTLYVANGNFNSTVYVQNNCWDRSEFPSSSKFVGFGPIVWLPADCQ